MLLCSGIWASNGCRFGDREAEDWCSAEKILTERPGVCRHGEIRDLGLGPLVVCRIEYTMFFNDKLSDRD